MKRPESKTAILLIGWNEQNEAPMLRKVRALLPFIDKPMLQIATEALVRLGCHHFHVFLDDEPESARQFLGNGERWGIDITYHYRDEEKGLFTNLKRLKLLPDEAYWLASAECIPSELINPVANKYFAVDSAFCWQTGAEKYWSGWGVLLGQTINEFSHLNSHQSINSAIVKNRRINLQQNTALFDLTNDQRYLESSIRRLQSLAKDAGNNIMITRGARIHPSAQLTGPVYIGANARIEADAIVGPNVVIGHDTIVDTKAEIRDSVILPETYVGGSLFLEQVVAAPGALASIKNNTLLSKIEPHLLTSSFTGNHKHCFWRHLNVILLRLLLMPLFVACRLMMKDTENSFRTEKKLRVFRPTSNGQPPEIIVLPIAYTTHQYPPLLQQGWLEHFVLIFYPNLNAIAKNQIKLFGLELRDVSDVAKLPEYWQSLYYAHSSGLLNESILEPALSTDASVRYANDVSIVAGLPSKKKWKIMVNYLGHVINDFGRLFWSPLISK